MDGCRVDGSNAPLVKSPGEMTGRFQAEVMTLLPEWKRRFLRDPGQLPESNGRSSRLSLEEAICWSWVWCRC